MGWAEVQAVGDRDGLGGGDGVVGLQASERAVGDAGDRVGGREALPEDDAIEQDAGVAEVVRGVDWVEVVQGGEDGAVEATPEDGGRVGEVDEIGVERMGQARQSVEVPEISGTGGRGGLRCVKVDVRRGFAKQALDGFDLPRANDEVNGLNLWTLEKTTREAGGVTGDTIRRGG